MQQIKDEKNKKTYHSPKLYNYGDIRSLTESTGATGADDGTYAMYQNLKTMP